MDCGADLQHRRTPARYTYRARPSQPSFCRPYTTAGRGGCGTSPSSAGLPNSISLFRGHRRQPRSRCSTIACTNRPQADLGGGLGPIRSVSPEDAKLVGDDTQLDVTGVVSLGTTSGLRCARPATPTWESSRGLSRTCAARAAPVWPPRSKGALRRSGAEGRGRSTVENGRIRHFALPVTRSRTSSGPLRFDSPGGRLARWA